MRRFTIRPPAFGAPPVPVPWLAICTPRHCCPTERCSWREATAVPVLLPPRNCTIRASGPGAPPAHSPTPALITPPRCCPMAVCLSPEDGTVVAISPARSSMTRQRGTGVSPVLSPLLANRTPPRCCPTVKSLWRGLRKPRFSRQRGDLRSGAGIFRSMAAGHQLRIIQWLRQTIA